MNPKRFYTLWFSQRNGSSLLCEALQSTGIAGRPGEHFHLPDKQNLLQHYKATNYQGLRQAVWQAGSTPNGVFGIKVNAPRKEQDPLMEEIRQLRGAVARRATYFQLWNDFFPDTQHIFLTRRNKIRQAVSWWKAIVSQEWHRKAGAAPGYPPAQIRDRYDFDAIRHLLLETSLREAKIQDMLEQAGTAALTVVYEDFILEYEATVERIMTFLRLPIKDLSIAPPYYERLADELSDEWTERFRKELQKDWEVVIW